MLNVDRLQDYEFDCVEFVLYTYNKAQLPSFQIPLTGLPVDNFARVRPLRMLKGTPIRYPGPLEFPGRGPQGFV